MAKDPAMLFYTSDFLTGVALMSMKERGQYITLLCLQQQRGHMTEKEMRKAVGSLSPELLSKFVSDAEGKLYNLRAEEEILKRSAHCQKQRENIQKRWGKESSSESSTGIGDGNTVVLPLENENENNNTRKEVKETEVISETGIKEDRGSGGKERSRKAKCESVFDDFAGENMALLSALHDFEAMRKTIKKPLTDRAKQMLLNKLQSLSPDPDVQVAILNQSIFHNWQGIFPPKGDFAVRKGGSGSEEPCAQNRDVQNLRKLYESIRRGE